MGNTTISKYEHHKLCLLNSTATEETLYDACAELLTQNQIGSIRNFMLNAPEEFKSLRLINLLIKNKTLFECLPLEHRSPELFEIYFLSEEPNVERKIMIEYNISFINKLNSQIVYKIKKFMDKPVAFYWSVDSKYYGNGHSIMQMLTMMTVEKILSRNPEFKVITDKYSVFG